MSKTSPFLRMAAIAALLAPAATQAGQAETPATRAVYSRRLAIQHLASRGPEAVPLLVRALGDESPLVRRAAARLLLEVGTPAKEALLAALGNSDLLVRRTALKAAWDLPTAKALPYLARGLKDKHVLVRQAAISHLATRQPRTDAVLELIRLAAKDDDDAVRQVAVKALWPFHREAVSIRDRADYDQDVKVARTIRLPKNGWRFSVDPRRDGHTKRWFAPAFDDSAWKSIAIEQAWQKAGVDYVGVAWYRRWVTLPPKPKQIAVDLRFGGVDECAWVWVNGRYVGQHDIGPLGWNVPFRLDVTKELKWGTKNQITVRAMNTAHAGGIWCPVEIEVLQR